jgi:ribonuclease HII
MDVHESEARRLGFRWIAGIDEAGRGPLAGPVVAAAVILPDGYRNGDINDSKALSPARREALYGVIGREAVAVGIGVVGPGDIDRMNILQATLGP